MRLTKIELTTLAHETGIAVRNILHYTAPLPLCSSHWGIDFYIPKKVI